jgi:hypothetical protein
MPRRCSYLQGNRQCASQGIGNPPLCRKHREQVEAEIEEDLEDDEEDMVEDFVEEVMDHPKVRGVFVSATSVIDRFSQLLDNVASGRRPDGTKWSQKPPVAARPVGEAPPRKAPPRQERQQHPPSAADDIAEMRRQLREAFVIMGIDPSNALTPDIIKKRKQELSRVYHPDLNSNGSVEMMKRLNAAADLLLASLKR